MAAGKSHTVVRLLMIVAAAVVLFAFVAYYNSRKAQNERFSTAAGSLPPPDLRPMFNDPLTSSQSSSAAAAGAAPMPNDRSSMTSASYAPAGPSPFEPAGNEKHLPVGGASDLSVGKAPIDPFPQDRITPDQLLPKDAANTKWAQVNPAGQGDVKDQNFLTAGYHLGFDTQGSSLRNASHDLRSTPPNPRYRVSIWQHSTIEPEIRRPIEM